LNWRRDEIILELSKKENDNGVLEILVDDLYNRKIDYIDELSNAERKRNNILKWIRYSFYIIVIVMLFNRKDLTFFNYGSALLIMAAVFILLSFFYAVKLNKNYKRVIDFERLKSQVINMSRLKILFNHKKEKVLNVYCTAGYPNLNSTMEVIHALAANGADLIELGMPYSDPLADGETIQESSAVALQNGMTIQVLFDQLKQLRTDNNSDKINAVPVILMGYLNPILQYGFERFCSTAASLGVDGLILPDLPEHEFEQEYGAIIKKYGLDFIFLVTPETSDDRIRVLDKLSSGFLYAVSSSATTGSDKDFDAVELYLKKLQDMNLTNPVLVGFGIKDKHTFESACKYANGAIIGTAYIKALAKNENNIAIETKQFLKTILD